MSLIEDELAMVSFPAATDPDEDHFSCCINEDISLCGKDISDLPWKPHSDDADCRVCVQTLRRDRCPLLGQCRGY